MFSLDDSMKPVRVVDKFCAAVILSPNQEVVTTAQGKIVRVPASSHFASAGDDGTLHGADKKKVGDSTALIYLEV